MIPINVYAQYWQNTTFHILGKEIEKSHFFPFSKLKIDI